LINFCFYYLNLTRYAARNSRGAYRFLRATEADRDC